MVTYYISPGVSKSDSNQKWWVTTKEIKGIMDFSYLGQKETPGRCPRPGRTQRNMSYGYQRHPSYYSYGFVFAFFQFLFFFLSTESQVDSELHGTGHDLLLWMVAKSISRRGSETLEWCFPCKYQLRLLVDLAKTQSDPTAKMPSGNYKRRLRTSKTPYLESPSDPLKNGVLTPKSRGYLMLYSGRKETPIT